MLMSVRLIAGARRFNHVIPLLCERYWLRSSSCITLKMAVMAYKCVHSMKADLLADYVWPRSSAATILRLLSSSSGRLFVPQTKTAVEDRSFAVAGPCLLNSLPACLCHIGRLLGISHVYWQSAKFKRPLLLRFTWSLTKKEWNVELRWTSSLNCLS